MLEQEMIRQLEEETQEYLANMKRFVELESPSFERKDASDRCCDFLEEKFSGLGFRTRRIPQTECGDHLYGELGSGRKRILIVGHYDTVFPVGTLATMPFHVEGNKAYGPGILDMKGGIMMAYFAIRLLLRRGLMPEGCVGFFFNGDEETGSFHSSDLIIEAARQYENVFVMEPGVDDLHAIKTHRFGRGTYHVIAHGKAAHSGSNSHQAISPLMEIARQLLRVEEWDKELNGSVTLAPTAIEGGEKETCMIPETANFTMDVRYATRELCEKVHGEIMALRAIDPRVRLEVQGRVDKPVMLTEPALFEKAKELAKPCGLELRDISIGGGSDGNFTADAGIPTLDGLGASGALLHNPGEFLNVDHFPQRTALTARLLMEL